VQQEQRESDKRESNKIVGNTGSSKKHRKLVDKRELGSRSKGKVEELESLRKREKVTGKMVDEVSGKAKRRAEREWMNGAGEIIVKVEEAKRGEETRKGYWQDG
jgi:hypothetical protein